jgi:hypothetical protein
MIDTWCDTKFTMGPAPEPPTRGRSIGAKAGSTSRPFLVRTITRFPQSFPDWAVQSSTSKPNSFSSMAP